MSPPGQFREAQGPKALSHGRQAVETPKEGNGIATASAILHGPDEPTRSTMGDDDKKRLAKLEAAAKKIERRVKARMRRAYKRAKSRR